MSGENNRLPKLRFPAFRDAGEWEEKRLIDISPSIFDGTHQTPSYTTEGIPFYSVENIVSGKANRFISREDYAIAIRKNKPEKDDILLTRIGKIGFSKVIDWDYEFSIYVTLAIIKRSKFFNSLYLHFYMQSARYQTEILRRSLLNAYPCKTNMDELRKTRVLLPRHPEQQKIADCLSSLDDLITAQAQKLDTLKTHKKGLMQQLFPTKGETIPKRRFPEFRDAGDWEEIEIGNIGAVSMCKRVMKNQTTNNGEIPFFKIGTFGKEPDAYISQELFEDYKQKYSYPKAGDILISASGTIGRLVVFDGSPSYFQDSNIVWIDNDESLVSNYFLLRCYEKTTWTTEGNTIARLYNSNLMSIKITISSLNEQQKIAACLTSLDDLITAQAQKLAHLKTHKKGLMQQLFPTAKEAI